MEEFFKNLWDSIYRNLVADDRYKILLEGLGNTFILALGAAAIGIIIGVVAAVARVSAVRKTRLRLWEKLASKLCGAYITVIRGTPVTVQLLIMYFIIFTPKVHPSFKWIPPLLVGVITFGINSGAYVAEIVRAGIMSVDIGQTEAGRSLGLDYQKTMRLIILPQAIKNILPALGNEFIILFKETSIAGYIAVRDLTRAAYIIQSITLNPYIPLFSAALMYLAIVIGLTKLLNLLERRLSAGDNR